MSEYFQSVGLNIYALMRCPKWPPCWSPHSSALLFVVYNNFLTLTLFMLVAKSFTIMFSSNRVKGCAQKETGQVNKEANDILCSEKSLSSRLEAMKGKHGAIMWQLLKHSCWKLYRRLVAKASTAGHTELFSACSKPHHKRLSRTNIIRMSANNYRQ